jgi:hypothetical protein
MKVLCAYFSGTPNVGDAKSSPGLYFKLGPVMDFSKATEADVIIYGGGSMSEAAIAHKAKCKAKIAWGIGFTRRYMYERHQDPDYSSFKIAGIRDYGSAHWVPCASCMSSLFDRKYDITTDVVFYGHKILSPMDQLNNDCMDMAKVIEHLASGETVVTSSYHGVYWATLLGRKVVCVPYGSKFYALKHMPVIVKKYEGQAGIAHPGALAESREANQKMYEDVKTLIEEMNLEPFR